MATSPEQDLWKERPNRGESSADFVARIARTYSIFMPKAMKVLRHAKAFETLENARTVDDLKPVLQYILEKLRNA